MNDSSTKRAGTGVFAAAGEYIASHWQGRQGFAWSFWVNFVLLRAAIIGVQEFMTPPLNVMKAVPSTPLDWRLAVAAAVFFHGILFVWQAVGVLRAGERWLAERGSQASVWGVQAALLAGFWITILQALPAFQFAPPQREIVEVSAGGESGGYRLDTVQGSDEMTISGSLDPGITRNLRSFLKRNPGVRTVVLESDGGNIYEARGIAKVIGENGMDTMVPSFCYSACTTAFIGGRTRRIADGARLGFHQYRLAGISIFTDSKAEERKDAELYLQAGVSAAFIEQMHHAPPSGMWYPPLQLLLSEGVIHQILE